MHRPFLGCEQKTLLGANYVGDSVAVTTQGTAIDLRPYTGIALVGYVATAITSTDTGESPEAIISIRTSDSAGFGTSTVLYTADTQDTGDTAGVDYSMEIDLQTCKRYLAGFVTIGAGAEAASIPVVMSGLFKLKGW